MNLCPSRLVFSIGALHMFVTFVSCKICGLEFTTVLSVLRYDTHTHDSMIALTLCYISGFLSLLPVISWYVVWVPVSIALYVSGAKLAAIFLASIHIFVELYVDAIILSFLPGNAYFVGLSVVMGVYGKDCCITIPTPIAPALAIDCFNVTISFMSFCL